MLTAQSILPKISPLDHAIDAISRARQDSLTKPPKSLGKLEDIAVRYVRITGNNQPKLNKKSIFVMAGDHGIAEEKVSAFPAEVTPQMVLNFLTGGAAINVLSRHAGCETKVVDMGVNYKFGMLDGLIDRKVGMGTKNFAKEEAMSEEDLDKCLKAGIELANTEADEGTDIIGIGEMGIANTTSATAIFCALYGLDPNEISGKGTGLDDAGVSRKAEVIKTALEKHAPFNSPLEVLRKVGGFEIAGLVGLIIGAASRNIPVVVDGFITTSAVAVAIELLPEVKERLFFAHISQEQAHKKVLEKIGGEPILDLGMRLGEGSGAALSISIIEASLKIHNEMATFESAGVSNKE